VSRHTFSVIALATPTLLHRLRSQRRRFGAALLLLLMALLPLRGWAEVSMHLGAQTAQAGAVAQSGTMAAAAPSSATDEVHPVTQPCHAETSSDTEASCSLCALCASMFLCAAESRVSLDTAASSDTATVSEGHGPPSLPLPERPPRD